LKDLGLALGVQKRYAEADAAFDKAQKSLENEGPHAHGLASLQGFRGYVWMLQGRLDRAQKCLLAAYEAKKRLRDYMGLPEVLAWLGEWQETAAGQTAGEERERGLAKARHWYLRALALRRYQRRYFECGARCGLLRVRLAQGGGAAPEPLVAEGQDLAR